jgi:FAD/FMN-containing dehydrogenase/Fe-S oxidoreductase
MGVVLPADAGDVVETVSLCRRYGAALLPRGAGTSLAGQGCNVAVVMDMSRHMSRILEIDPGRRLARVQPGVVLDDLRDAAERFHLTFGPDPATHSHCTLGGMIGNDSCGVHSVMSGRTSHNVESLDILTYDGTRLRVGSTADAELEAIIHAGGRRGEIYARLRDLRDRYADQIRARFPGIPRRVSGYSLDQLLPENGFNVARALVGTEGTCVTVLEASLRLVESPPIRTLLVLGYPDMADGADDVVRITERGAIGLEGIDKRLVGNSTKKGLNPYGISLLPAGDGWLLAEFGGDTLEEANGKALRLMDELGRDPHPPTMRLFDDPREARAVWAVREAGLGATARAPGENDAWEGWEDSAVAPEKIGKYVRDLRALYQRYGYVGAIYGHLGQGCVHTRIDFDFHTAPGLAKFRAFMEDAADLVVSYGGSLSGEHGDGQSRAELLPKMYGEELVGAFREFKAIWDPDGRMNPGKVVDPYRFDENLRHGPDYHPLPLATHFRLPDDDGSFARAILRCVGVGRCRKEHGGMMCPSFMATHEEMHSTRGRARLLFEMVRGETISTGWHSEEVKEALDLCLACKACKSECPVQVDMATYKAEFLSHYYAGRLRPPSAYAFGLIFYWARIAARMPALVNAFSQTPVFRDIGKAMIGIAKQRRLPAFASEPFTTWFARSRSAPVASPRPVTGTTAARRVLLWPDTFNNYFHPETAKAAVRVLEALGFEVALPSAHVCCGRPVYDYGMLDTGKQLLRQALDVLGPEIERGTPVVGLEPSCVSVFRDELPNLFPGDERAQRLKGQIYLLSEFIEHEAASVDLPQLDAIAILHGHCHQKAIMGMDHELRLLSRIGVSTTAPDAGCCGMAGAFGFERGEHYDVAIKAGERALLPAVRSAPPESLIIADGFSCREQVGQGTDRRALHLAQVLDMAFGHTPPTPGREYPERSYEDEAATLGPRTLVGMAIGGLALAAVGVAVAKRQARAKRRGT